MTAQDVLVDTKADVEFGNGGVWTNVAAQRPTALTTVTLENHERGTRIRAVVDLGALADHAEVIVPFADLAEFVDQVRESAPFGEIDGFEDALDGRPPRGCSRKYNDAYTLGQVEARARAE
ncbi:hypothetical protein SEA_PCORAL7_55 [Gordonia phage PCoral7]|uniref:Uncharacterized protein n=1 Tax=Gordonia phage Toast TaxID=2599852 RepID=A0A5J6TC15_9CAUD|nr:hypothetical protein JZX81_gp55 [Gordonia phage Toast]QFG08115.1 hypothetical protein PBI_TOAST_55 [Gordonia phage Toast]UVF60563.1 hypothetical protein SEA_PCORAL7_55 [Gordonia phage PCoral7]